MSQQPPVEKPDEKQLDKVPAVGSKEMPAWTQGELPDPPKFTLRRWAAMLGPGLFMAGAAIGGGEWLTGPVITARYGGGLLWLATLSILAQVVYNIEVSRYTLYSGEPIFVGKLRTMPGPKLWLIVYLMFDAYMFFPYLAANAAIPLLTAMGVDISNPGNELLVKGVSIAIFLAFMLPLVIGGKVYNSVRALMTAKVLLVLGFLLLVALLFAKPSDWGEAINGFFKFGNVPIRRIEDANGNGVLDPGEDWDGDGRLDVIEPSLKPIFDTNDDGEKDATDVNLDGKPDRVVEIKQGEETTYWPDLDDDGKPDSTVMLDTNGDGKPDQNFPLDKDEDGKLDRFINIDGDKVQDGDNLDNIFLAIFQGRSLPKIDFGMMSLLCALVAISGLGGLTNSSFSNYTREQGWGMGAQVGAIPSLLGGHRVQLSHVGAVFEPTTESLARWRGWVRHVVRDQLAVWMPGCFVGVALPAMLSIVFLDRGVIPINDLEIPSFTATGAAEYIGTQWGPLFWALILLCGFLVLGPSVTPSSDGFLRRWVDAFWVVSRRAHKLNPESIRYVYFIVLAIYTAFGVVMLCLEKPITLLFIATLMMNFALGFSCLHTLVVNLYLLPRECRPGWFNRIGLLLAGLFFLSVATLSTIVKLYDMGFF